MLAPWLHAINCHSQSVHLHCHGPHATTPTQVSARALLELARQALPAVPDSSMRKDLKALSDHLHARCRQHGLSAEPLSPEEIGGLLQE